MAEPASEHPVSLPPPAPPDARLRGFWPLGIAAMLLILLTGNIFVAPMLALPVGGLLALLWAWRSRTPWREIGYSRPRSWALTIVVGIALGVAFKFLMKAVVMPWLGAPPVNQAFHFLAGNTALLPAATWTMLMAGFGEETVYRGYLFERLGKLLGERPGAKIVTVLLTSAWFAAAHAGGQGLPGVQQAAVTGLAFGAIYATTRRIWIPMIAHAAFDLTALWMIYWDLETTISHLIFK